jgi:hypothetical protein
VLILTNVSAAHAGLYAVEVSNPGSTSVSRNARLTVSGGDPVRFTQIVRLANGQFQLRLSGPAGKNVSIQASTNNAIWLPLASLVLTNSTGEFTDTLSPGFPLRFYRATTTP